MAAGRMATRGGSSNNGGLTLFGHLRHWMAELVRYLPQPGTCYMVPCTVPNVRMKV